MNSEIKAGCKIIAESFEMDYAHRLLGGFKCETSTASVEYKLLQIE